jgi:hypothetical protein
MASVLAIQALFFADGGLLALGCNIFNLGFFPCFIAYPLIYKNIVGNRPGEKRLFAAAAISAVVALQLGAFSVVVQTVISGVSELPFDTFVLSKKRPCCPITVLNQTRQHRRRKIIKAGRLLMRVKRFRRWWAER